MSKCKLSCTLCVMYLSLRIWLLHLVKAPVKATKRLVRTKVTKVTTLNSYTITLWDVLMHWGYFIAKLHLQKWVFNCPSFTGFYFLFTIWPNVSVSSLYRFNQACFVDILIRCWWTWKDYIRIVVSWLPSKYCTLKARESLRKYSLKSSLSFWKFIYKVKTLRRIKL